MLEWLSGVGVCDCVFGEIYGKFHCSILNEFCLAHDTRHTAYVTTSVFHTYYKRAHTLTLAHLAERRINQHTRFFPHLRNNRCLFEIIFF